MPAIIEKTWKDENGIYHFSIIVKCNFGRKPNRHYEAILDPTTDLFIDIQQGQSILDASFSSRLRDAMRAYDTQHPTQ